MTDPLLIRTLKGEIADIPPIWLMRQAGRYLPEYRETRAKADGFVDLCLTPELAIEVTLQPIRRFGFDASILFSDILMVPYGLGRNLRFEEGVGPILDPIADMSEIGEFDEERFHGLVGNVYQTVRGVREALDPGVALIGFAGSPWTVGSYMVEGGSSRDFAKLKTLAYADPNGFDRLMDLLVDATVAYLSRQVDAGAQVLKLFDSWAGAAPESVFRRAVIKPTREIVRRVRDLHPDIPVIGFARGAGAMTRPYAEETGIDGLALDSSLPLAMACALQSDRPVQGNLDPMALVAGGEALESELDAMLGALGNGPYIVNLGHGIVPHTPISHVEKMIARVRGQD